MSGSSPAEVLGCSLPLAGDNWCERLFLHHLLPRLLGSSSSSRRFHIHLFFWRRKDCCQSKRVDPQFTTPAHAMVQMFVFLVLDLPTRTFQGFAFRRGHLLSRLSHEFPVLMVLGLY